MTFSDGMKYELDTEFMVERDIDGMPSKLSSFNSQQQHHILCVNETDPIEYHSEQIEIQEYDELDEEEEEEHDTSTVVSTKGRSDVNRSQSSHVNANTESHHSTQLPKPSTSAQYHSNDPDERFLLSCLPIFQRLSNKKNALARLKIQQLLFDIEFNDDNS